MDPRSTLDAAGQRLQSLIYRSLTHIDTDLQVQGDLAESWQVTADGLHWLFRIRPDVVDQERRSIDAQDIAACLENYRTGKPSSPYKSSFPSWEKTRAENGTVILDLHSPDPYLARNVSLLRFFRKPGSSSPCEEQGSEPALIASGRYKPAAWGLPENELTLVPMDRSHGELPIRFEFIKDPTTLLLKLLRGELDASLTSLSLSKTRLIKRYYPDRFDVLERDGIPVSYMAFNLRDPILARLEVRRAITLAIDRQSIVRDHLFEYGSLAGSFLAPAVPEAYEADFKYNLEEARRLLGGEHLTLHYKATPDREGIEQAQILQNMLEKIGIYLVIDVVEPAVFFASIRSGDFQLFCSRWVGAADGSIFRRTLRSGEKFNYSGYKNNQMDQWLDQAMREGDAEKRRMLLVQVQKQMAEDLPYFPLYFWKNAIVLRKGVSGIAAKELSLSGSLEPLTKLRLKENP